MAWTSLIVAIFFLALQINCIQHGRRVVCYMGSWAIYANENLKFDVDDAEPALNMCTHLVYLFAIVDGNTLQMTLMNPDRDIELRGIPKTIALKKKHPHLRVMISVGGWDNGSENFSKMARNEKTRRAFINSALEFLRVHDFDGLDLNWQFPGTRGGTPQDRANLVLLAKELREEFDKSSLILSIAVSCLKNRIDAGIDGKGLAEHAHFLNVLNYEYHGFWDNYDHVNAPLTSNDELSVDFSVQYYLKMGADPSSLNLGLSSYFTTYQLREGVKSNVNLTGLPSASSSFKSPLNGETGFMSFYELCTIMDSNKNWKVAFDAETQMPFAVNFDQVVSMDVAATYASKIKYAMENRLGGVIYYGLEKDDFKGSCRSSKHQKFPTLSSIDKALNQYSGLVFKDIVMQLKKFNSHFFWNGMQA